MRRNRILIVAPLGLLLTASSLAFGQMAPIWMDTSAQAKVFDVLPAWQTTLPSMVPEHDVGSSLNEIGSLLSDNPQYYGRAPILAAVPQEHILECGLVGGRSLCFQLRFFACQPGKLEVKSSAGLEVER